MEILRRAPSYSVSPEPQFSQTGEECMAVLLLRPTYHTNVADWGSLCPLSLQRVFLGAQL